MNLRTRRIQTLIEAHPRVCTYAVRIYWDIYSILPLHKPREKGCVIIFWKGELKRHIEVIEEGSEKLYIIQINSLPRKTLLMNTYMPTNDRDQYLAVLNEVHEL